MRRIVWPLTLLACGHRPAPMPPGAPYGAWASPVTAAMATAAAIDIGEPRFAGDAVLWLEARPDGRSVLLERAGGRTRELVPGISVRTDAHNYGGGSYVATADLVVYANEADHRLYRLDRATDATRPLTPASPDRYADCELDLPRGRALCVRDARPEGALPIDTIVAVDLEGRSAPETILSGHDFFAAPRLDPDGRALAWLSWDHPHMPWDASDLWVAAIGDDGLPGPPEHVAGGPDESILEPTWSPDGALHFLSDRTGFWNLYGPRGAEIGALAPMDADVGRPPWELGESFYAFTEDDRIVLAARRDDAALLFSIDRRSGALSRLPFGDDVIRGGVRIHGARMLARSGSGSTSRSLVEIDLGTGRATTIAGGGSPIDARHLSRPERLSFPTPDGARAHALYYPPVNADVRPPAHERPPLIVCGHGGPTWQADPVLDPMVQFWTSRGFAFVAVNYGGSSGYGRPYRHRLYGKWGVVDVDDSIAAARWLAKRGDVDERRLLVRGESAGGYTTLAALGFRRVFRAGASWYGLTDPERLHLASQASDKLESHYMESLFGPYPATRARWDATNPFRRGRISAPVIFFQGGRDPIVLPDQSRIMHEALVRQGIPTAYLEFPEEEHGFRVAENNRRALEAELYFYQRVLGIPTAGPPPIRIDNLPAAASPTPSPRGSPLD